MRLAAAVGRAAIRWPKSAAAPPCRSRVLPSPVRPTQHTACRSGGQWQQPLLVVRAMSAEAEKSEQAAAAGASDGGQPTIFDKIVAKQIPADVIYEDDDALAFRDINPQAPVHFLVIPKHRNGLTQLSKATEANAKILGHLLLVAGKVALQEGCERGFRVVINDGPDGCQSVYHLHLHIMGGRKLNWPPG